MGNLNSNTNHAIKRSIFFHHHHPFYLESPLSLLSYTTLLVCMFSNFTSTFLLLKTEISFSQHSKWTSVIMPSHHIEILNCDDICMMCIIKSIICRMSLFSSSLCLVCMLKLSSIVFLTSPKWRFLFHSIQSEPQLSSRVTGCSLVPPSLPVTTYASGWFSLCAIVRLIVWGYTLPLTVGLNCSVWG